jgi:hypothetical protein
MFSLVGSGWTGIYGCIYGCMFSGIHFTRLYDAIRANCHLLFMFFLAYFDDLHDVF